MAYMQTRILCFCDTSRHERLKISSKFAPAHYCTTVTLWCDVALLKIEQLLHGGGYGELILIFTGHLRRCRKVDNDNMPYNLSRTAYINQSKVFRSESIFGALTPEDENQQNEAIQHCHARFHCG